MRRRSSGVGRALAALAVVPSLACVAAALVAMLLAGCPQKPMPPPDGPPPAPAPVVTCIEACAHAETVCPGSLDVCDQLCPGAQAVDPGYAPCVMAATGCMNCDANARAAAAGKGRP